LSTASSCFGQYLARPMFKILAVLVAIYVAYSLATGSVYARSGWWGRTFQRSEDGWRYWSAIAAYSVLVILLFFVF